MSTIRDLIKRALYNTGYYHLVARTNSSGKPRLLVLFYHTFRSESPASDRDAFDLSNPTAAQFEAHIREITKNYRVVELEKGLQEVRDGTLPRDSVAISFDDGFDSVYTVAYPLLRKYDVPATVFLLTDWVNSGRPCWWSTFKELVRQSQFRGVSSASIEDTLGMSSGVEFGRDAPTISVRRRMIEVVEPHLRDLADGERACRIDRLATILFPSGGFVPETEGPLNWDQIREMADNKIGFESHTCSHINIRHADSSIIESEIIVSKNQIENRLQREVTGFAYPYGKDVSAYSTVHPLLKKLGFRYACTTCPGIISAATDPYSLGRSGLPLSSSRALLHRTLIIHFAQPHVQAFA